MTVDWGPTIRLGTRSSALAVWQARTVSAGLQQAGARVELIHITTRGDADSGAIGSLGEQGLFTKEIQRRLLAGDIDVAVHSLKDLPTDAIPGLTLAAVPARGPVEDVLVGRDGETLSELAPSSVIGTGSVRRRSQLLFVRGDLKIADIRGNVDTRLRKLDEGRYDAIILAAAGLHRLGLERRITEVLPESIMLPAVGQGALGIECRSDDLSTRELLRTLDHPDSHSAVVSERAMLSTLRGGCLAPVGALARVEDDRLQLSGVVLDAAGSRRLFARETAAVHDAHSLGIAVAQSLLEQGAAELISREREL
jgi:hydroxymethylbilane synthase